MSCCSTLFEPGTSGHGNNKFLLLVVRSLIQMVPFKIVLLKINVIVQVFFNTVCKAYNTFFCNLLL